MFPDVLDGIEINDLSEMVADDLVSSDLFYALFDIEDEKEQERVHKILEFKAGKLNQRKAFNGMYRYFKGKQKDLQKEFGCVTTEYKMTEITWQEYPLRCGQWIVDDFGVRRSHKDKDSADSEIWACRLPIIPTALLENISTGVEKVRLEFIKGGKRREIICERSMIASTNNIIKLADKGVEVTSENAKHLIQYLSDVITDNLSTLPRLKATSQLGWHNDEFAPYDEGIVFDGDKENKYLFDAISEKGDKDEWIRFTQTLRKNEAVRLMMDASFASVLIEKVSALPFVFHLYGGTGTGKTVALMVASSIWGNPASGKMVRTLNMTQNSMLSTAAFLNSIPFAGDELQSVKSKWENYDTLIMRITEGIDRGRMTYSTNNEVKSWHNSFLFTGEEPCTKSNSGGGVKNRVIDCEIESALFENANAVVNFCLMNYGWAGREFVQKVVEKQDEIITRFSTLQKEIMDLTTTTEKQASSMALILLADALAGETFYAEEQPLPVSISTKYVTPENEVDVSERAYEWITDFIAENENHFEVDCRNGNWGKVDEYSNAIWFNATVLKRVLADNGFEFDAVKKKWASKGYIEKSTEGKYTHSTSINGVRARYVKIAQMSADEKTTDEAPFDFDI